MTRRRSVDPGCRNIGMLSRPGPPPMDLFDALDSGRLDAYRPYLSPDQLAEVEAKLAESRRTRRQTYCTVYAGARLSLETGDDPKVIRSENLALALYGDDASRRDPRPLIDRAQAVAVVTAAL